MKVCILKILFFDGTDVSEGIDDNKIRWCDACHYWYVLNKDFKFQTNLHNRCHDLLMTSMNHGDIAVLNIKGFDYHFISLISKKDVIILMQSVDLIEKMEHYKT